LTAQGTYLDDDGHAVIPCPECAMLEFGHK